MKKTIKYILSAVICLGIASCSNDIEIADNGPVGNPEKAVEGVYTGSWSRTLNGETAEATGTITMTPVDTANYVTKVHVECPEFGLDMESVANVVNTSSGYIYYNQESSNGFQNAFTGNVTSSGVTIKFSKTDKYQDEKKKWKTATSTYEFAGGK